MSCYHFRPIIQIYEVTSPADVNAIADIELDHVGLWTASQSIGNALSFEAARSVFATFPRHFKKVALTLTGDVSEVEAIIRHTRPDIVHIGSRPHQFSPEQTVTIKKRHPHVLLMRSIPAGDEKYLKLAKNFDGPADFLLLDTFDTDADNFGATGKTHNWQLSRKIVEQVRIPVILAGGLGPDNVAEAICTVKPAGVDSKTKTDIPGTHLKDPERVRQFVWQVRKLTTS